jgi:hypothetical protein
VTDWQAIIDATPEGLRRDAEREAMDDIAPGAPFRIRTSRASPDLLEDVEQAFRELARIIDAQPWSGQLPRLDWRGPRYNGIPIIRDEGPEPA